MSVTLIRFATCAMLLSGLTWLSHGDVLKKDMLDLERVNIKGKTGELRGYMKKDVLIGDRGSIHDRNGEQRGWFEKGGLNPNRWKFREK